MEFLLEPTLVTVFLAASPILMVLYLMIGRHWGGSKAGPAGWLTAVLVSLLFFGVEFSTLLVAWTKAILLAFFVLYIIWMALLLYNTVNEAGVISAIGQEMPGIAWDKPAQALLLAWIFGAFLQGATGFGVPAAVVAPLLVGMGFAAGAAVVIALLGHAWAVTFGSLGSSFVSLIASTGMSGNELASPTAVLLAITCLGCGLGVLWLQDRGTAIRKRGLFVILLTVVMGGTQWAIALSGLWTLAALGAGLAGLLVAIPLLSFETNRMARVQPSVPESMTENNQSRTKRLLVAFFPYMLLIIVVLLGQLLFRDVLNTVKIDPVFPAVCTSKGWCIPEGAGRSISIFGHGGALLLYASLLAYLWYRWRGPLPTAYSPNYSGRVIGHKTLKGMVKPTIGVYSLVAMALTMEHAGMTQLLAQVLSQTGLLFPFLSPLIGALGAFMTGSNTNSNVVFGQLQGQTASVLALSIPLILAAQTTGGAIGSLFAPAKVIVGCSTVSGADEGHVLKLASITGLVIIAVIGFLVWVLAAFISPS
jgi:lactate permease